MRSSIWGPHFNPGFETIFNRLSASVADVITDIQTHQEIYGREVDGNKRQRALVQIQRGLIRSQEIEDEKLQLVGHVIEHIDIRARQLEQDLENLGKWILLYQDYIGGKLFANEST